MFNDHQRWYDIDQVCQLVSVAAHVIKYWQSEFKFINARLDTKGQRYYDEHSLQLLMRIKYLTYYQGYTLAQVNTQLIAEINSPPNLA